MRSRPCTDASMAAMAINMPLVRWLSERTSSAFRVPGRAFASRSLVSQCPASERGRARDGPVAPNDDCLSAERWCLTGEPSQTMVHVRENYDRSGRGFARQDLSITRCGMGADDQHAYFQMAVSETASHIHGPGWGLDRSSTIFLHAGRNGFLHWHVGTIARTLVAGSLRGRR